MKTNIRTLLVVRTSALGDVAMTVPAIYSLAEQHHDVKIKVLTESRFVSLFVGAPANVSFVHYDKKRYHGVGGALRLLRRLAEEKPDAVADLHNVLRSWVIDAFFLVHGKRVSMLDKQRADRRRILNGGDGAAVTPFTERYFDVFRRMGFTLDSTFRALTLSAVNLPGIPEKGQERWVGIAPFARYANKAYPEQQVEELVRRLSETPGVRVFLFGGGRREVELIHGWVERYPNVTSFAGQFSLGEELALMARLDVMLSMDSANQHLASLAGVRVVSVWGSTTPACGFMGWRQKAADALVAGCSCQPCTIAGSNNCPKGDYRCLRTLAPEFIYKRLLE